MVRLHWNKRRSSAAPYERKSASLPPTTHGSPGWESDIIIIDLRNRNRIAPEVHAVDRALEG